MYDSKAISVLCDTCIDLHIRLEALARGAKAYQHGWSGAVTGPNGQHHEDPQSLQSKVVG